MGEEDANAECDLLTGIGRQVEDQNREVGDANAGDDEVYSVEECLAT